MTKKNGNEYGKDLTIKKLIPQLPHERDESVEQHPSKPNKKMKQAFVDLNNGLVDTDLHGERGVEEVVKFDVKHKLKLAKKLPSFKLHR
ncbi:hypothetical protein QN372_17580 [Undibacterium sp. RTI2.1]|uniref:hypothetical protein n=1 Tax=unclassified Undibacterium TaxID=2630295 RepID=UPI002AB342DD|nr:MULTISPECIES: hypothetical protein [unclassified Undibacterium]MDY7540687.1 hypothetical protein [Undibacterium sp. 5I1]MEB0032565.1 hypothetical protein [Undibacterium sp. RTI2.1]MEB0118630.1 hypothetical protein [Undibacterium sp. RTI2.2]MEB0232852.1 hypothetical protein [Undibacterium sp. 10I3]MEB0259727.1 hypothetical protein [Undibacterium sp. 5I1]